MDVLETKACTRCHFVLPLTSFGKSTRYRGGHRTWCKCCHGASNNEYNKRNIERYRERKRNYMRSPKGQDGQRQRKYGLTRQQWESICERQGFKCAICELETRRLIPDHDHKTGKVRGALCIACNTGIGLLRDDVYLLTKALSYLCNGS